jgi:RNA polymerase sigma factor (TIGR02999 family)
MEEPAQTTVTRLLVALEGGDRAVLDEIFPRLYDELRGLAHLQRHRWDGDYTLNTTALVHELYLKLVDQDRVGVKSRLHFHALAGKAMRHILSNYARAARTKKRGGGSCKLSLDEARMIAERDSVLSEGDAELLCMLDDSLSRLEQLDPRRGQVVECRFYGGMSIPETADALGVSPRTVKRDWTVAQAWLHRELKNRF